ncbi:MAG: hypothetical protein MJB14_01475 [Spirochaetes bacterium]|nr:hypothetical protein [Spirochaetota bacterium]
MKKYLITLFLIISTIGLFARGPGFGFTGSDENKITLSAVISDLDQKPMEITANEKKYYLLLPPVAELIFEEDNNIEVEGFVIDTAKFHKASQPAEKRTRGNGFSQNRQPERQNQRFHFQFDESKTYIHASKITYQGKTIDIEKMMLGEKITLTGTIKDFSDKPVVFTANGTDYYLSLSYLFGLVIEEGAEVTIEGYQGNNRMNKSQFQLDEDLDRIRVVKITYQGKEYNLDEIEGGYHQKGRGPKGKGRHMNK